MNPCKFPFIHNKETYKSCTKMDHYNLWCATTVNATNHTLNWGFCNDFCPLEEDEMLKENSTLKDNDTLKGNEVADKPWLINLLVGILVGILLIIAFIIGYRCIIKNTNIAVQTPEITDEYTIDPIMNGNQAMINSDMILNEQAGLLPYSGKLEVDKCRFEMGKKLGGGSFGGVYEGIIDDTNQPGQKNKVAIKTVNNPEMCSRKAFIIKHLTKV
jgi:hypothetical protein